MVNQTASGRQVHTAPEPLRVVYYKGSRGPGHMGNDRVTAQNLKVVLVDAERNLIGVNGAIPGPKGGVVMIKEARKQ